MHNTPFIGIGPNPDGVDLPLGFGMRLAQEPGAIDAFGALDEARKADVIHYIQACATGEEAKERIETAVTALKNNNLTILTRI